MFWFSNAVLKSAGHARTPVTYTAAGEVTDSIRTRGFTAMSSERTEVRAMETNVGGARSLTRGSRHEAPRSPISGRVGRVRSEPRSVANARATVDATRLSRPRPGLLRQGTSGLALALVAADVVALFATAGFASGPVSVWITFAAIVLCARVGLRHYRPRMALSVLDDVPRTLASAIGAAVLTATAFATFGTDLDRQSMLIRAASFVAVALVLEAAILMAERNRRRNGEGQRTLIVGTGAVGRTVSDALQEHPELGLRPVGFADPDRTGVPASTFLPVLTDDMGRLAEYIDRFDIETVVLAFGESGDAHVDTIIGVHQTGCTIMIVPSMFELHSDGPDVERVRGVPLLRLRPDPTLRPSWWIKRSIDIAFAATALFLLAIPMSLVALAILVESGRPILFWQERVGLDGHHFRLSKFRSMRPRDENESQTMWNIGSDPRVGRIGKFLRRSSVDEIPQLWNILRGQMSLVGPRPERPTFVQQFSDEHERYWARHRVPVGLTGLAQVNGLRGDTSIRERARYDNYYIANWSLWLDMKIIILTVREVLGGHGR